MVGILSLLDALYEVAMEDLVRSLHLSERVSAALLRREGPFGDLLRFVERMERLEVGEALDEVRSLQLTREQVLEAQWKAFAWRSAAA
jgi:EAL and modified HD-GYP domain-containing signal transduction protein